MEKTTKTIDVEICCPNCQAMTSATYDALEKRPSVFGKCWFCSTMFRWRKCSTIEVIPAERKKYIINISSSYHQ